MISEPGIVTDLDEGNLEDRRYEAVWNALRIFDDGDRNHRVTLTRAILDALDGVES